MRSLVCLLLVVALPAQARSLCGAVEEAALLAALSGAWHVEERISLENATVSFVRAPMPVRAEIGPEGLSTPFLDDLGAAPLALHLADPRPYDVDAVDDMLDATGHDVLADRLSDTPCGPELLPQLVARLPDGSDVDGTVTLVAYFHDRLLQITEMTLRSDETVLFLTGTALLTRLP